MNTPHIKVNLVNRMVKGCHDFDGTRKEDLSFSKMERLTVISHTDDPNWVKAKNGKGQEGLIPLDYVTVLQEVKLGSMGWFHGGISREEAEKLLTPREDGFFLVRESTNFPGDYTLCVCFQDKFEHYRVILDKYKKLTIDDEEDFDTLPSLIEHYEKDADGLCTKLKKFAPNVRFYEAEMKRAFRENGWTIEKCDLTLTDTILGKGEFGDVRLGEFKGQKVAVKTLNDKIFVTQSILEEACHMTSLNHENLVSFLGIVFDDSTICLVTEYMSKGSLVEYLRTRGRILISKRNQINFACDIANGMVYLESKVFVHRDLAARNVLLHENGTAKVGDFGLTIRTNQPMKKSSDADKGKFPIKWTAPEALKHNKFSNKSDMWSFGVLLWEIYSFGRVPYPRTPLTDVMKFIESGGRMSEPNDCPPGIYQLMQKAWNENPEERPTFKEALRKLKEIQHQTPLV
ncbi:Tyrosine-protein kinase CSK [Armadillidium vulgare]|nr:Tyrosine-protein kinase CSK [Armadillidium vulgare]